MDADLAEQAFHAERAGLIGHDGNDQLAQFGVLEQRGEDAHEAHGGGLAAFATALQLGGKGRQRRHRQRIDVGHPRRQLAALGLAALREIALLGTARRGAQVRHVFQLVVTDRQLKPVTERTHGIGAHFLELVIDVLAFTGLAHAEAFHRLGQDHARPDVAGDGLRVGGVNLLRIVTAAGQCPDLVIAQVCDQRQQLGILAEEVFAHVGTVLRLEGLVVAIHALHHALAQQAGAVLGEQRIPATTPDHLDDVPAGGAEGAFQFLDHLGVAAHRAVEPLQIAVHHEHQVVQALAAGHGNGGQRFGLVHFAIAKERPDLAALVLLQAAVFQVAHVARLVGGGQRTQAHRHGGELPEIGHQPWVRVGRQAVAVGFAAEVVHAFGGDAAFDEGAAVDARGRMALDVDHVAVEGVGAPTEEVVEAHVVQHRGRLVGGDVAAHVGVLAGTQHHHHRVPADHRVEPALDRQIARVGRLALQRDAVDVGGPGARMQVAVVGHVLVAELVDQVVRTRPPGHLGDRLQGFTPFLGFLGVGIEGGERRVHGPSPAKAARPAVLRAPEGAAQPRAGGDKHLRSGPGPPVDRGLLALSKDKLCNHRREWRSP
ncbi:hypothetical protein D3C71_1183650 [compost metagenome]